MSMLSRSQLQKSRSAARTRQNHRMKSQANSRLRISIPLLAALYDRMSGWSDDPLVADVRDFYKVEK